MTVLARGERYQQITEHGIVVAGARGEQTLVAPVKAVDTLATDAAYDLIIVLVRKTQLSAALPALAANRGTRNILFMVNNAAGPDEIAAAVGRDRVMLGFPGAGGTREGHIVRAVAVPASVQKTTIGELDGTISARLTEAARAFRDAGFAVAVSTNMDAWLKTHVALVSPIANGFYMAGDNYRLAKSPQGVRLTVRSIREGMRVLRALGIPLTPGRMRLFEVLPESLLAFFAGRIFAMPFAELVMSKHAFAARDEMIMLADELRQLARRAGVPTPASDELYQYAIQ